jgi:hypothetical protein
MKSFLVMLSLIIVLGISLGSTAYGKVLWMDTFDDGKIDSAYLFQSHPGKWVEKDGVISQTSATPGDTCYLIYPGGFDEPHTAIVKMRIDDWTNGDYARAGLGFRLTTGGAGYAFLVHNILTNMEFLNDALAWKNNDTPPPFDELEIGTWYWMKAEMSANKLTGKIWPDGETEPAKWLLDSALDFGAVRAVSGNVGLNGGSSSGADLTLVSFDDWAIFDNADEATPNAFALSVESSGKLSSTWGSIKLGY